VVSATKYFSHWKNVPIEEKVKIIQRYADLLEMNQERLLYICVKEAGKTIRDAINDIREAIDFCHYYCNEALKIFSKPVELKGPTGEENKLFYEGKGVYFAISPWNFPVAIFLGQILAPLLAGNTLLAKPAEQTSVVSYELIKLLFKAGLPPGALQLLLGDGKKIADLVLNNVNLKGVVFTGSCQTANEIKKKLNNKDGEIIPLTAETGGLNFMIVDSSALIEQVVDDVIESGFHSAGQRCSALRVLAVQDDIYDKTVAMLKGAIQEIKVGQPQDLTSDVGPVIDQEAKNKITNHIKTFEKNILSQTIIQKELRGFYVAPTLIEISDLIKIKEEIFGPVVHVYKYQANQLETLVHDINQLNYGLTLGIQSRIENTINYIFNNANVGNIYINRNIVGAVVGLQPFGGRGLSGTGPKAGGPNYLLKFANEKVFTYNTTAAGGNASLLMLDEN
jgi:RHH-type proline utilization regulon transcriptional repressor/proline dehydrogenase/delta 1-pyrroline-5-carboxylate dehydrogenase